jgi:N-methylhydantoinase B/oxoprolinase/acetone carboxylase alpha subunit
MGVTLLSKLISEYGIDEFKQYVDFICQNAAESVRTLLCSFSEQHQMKGKDTLTNL